MLSINEMLQLRPKPESYRAKKHDDMISSGTAVQEKLDGWRMTIMRLEGNEVHIIGRKSYINYWDSIKHHFTLADRILGLPWNTVLDGEYHHPDRASTDVPTMLVEHSGDFTPWAIPWLEGECLTSQSVPQANVALMKLGWTPPPIHHMGSRSADVLMREAEEHGIEGYVLKTAQWDLGSWIKVKPTRTFDLVITGIVKGTSRNEGRIGSLCVSARDGTEVGKVGGLSDELRSASPEVLLGSVVEIRAQDVTKDGRLKFARLVRFRDDKDPTDINTLKDLIG